MEIAISSGYLSWLHEVTRLAYQREISLKTCDKQLLEFLYQDTDSPEEAVDRLADVKRRVRAINQDYYMQGDWERSIDDDIFD